MATHKEKDLSKAAFRLHLCVTLVLKPRLGFQAKPLGLRSLLGDLHLRSTPSSLPSCNLLIKTGSWGWGFPFLPDLLASPLISSFPNCSGRHLHPGSRASPWPPPAAAILSRGWQLRGVQLPVGNGEGARGGGASTPSPGAGRRGLNRTPLPQPSCPLDFTNRLSVNLALLREATKAVL